MRTREECNKVDVKQLTDAELEQMIQTWEEIYERDLDDRDAYALASTWFQREGQPERAAKFAQKHATTVYRLGMTDRQRAMYGDEKTRRQQTREYPDPFKDD